jgi:transposase
MNLDRRYGYAEFATIVVDHTNRRAFELVDGRSGAELEAGLMRIPGRDNIEWVTLDLLPTYRSFTRNFFPNAKIVADKFHVLRLLNPVINRRRKEITGDKRTNPLRRLLLCSGKRLDFFQRSAMYRWLDEHPALKEIYHFKEALSGLYRVTGYERAKRAFSALTERMASSTLPEIQTLRRTLISWRTEILNYFITRLTNARCEGINNKAMTVRTRAYGYRSFQNYRLRVLNA